VLEMDARGRRVVKFVAFAVLVVVVVWYVSIKRAEMENKNLGQPVQKDLSTRLATQQRDFYSEYRLSRDRTRSQQLDLYRELINNANADPAVRKEANQNFLKITQSVGKEAELENLIRAKGFEDVIVCLYETSAVAMVKAKDLTQPDVAKIADTISRGTGIKAENVTVIPKVQ